MEENKIVHLDPKFKKAKHYVEFFFAIWGNWVSLLHKDLRVRICLSLNHIFRFRITQMIHDDDSSEIFQISFQLAQLTRGSLAVSRRGKRERAVSRLRRLIKQRCQ